MKIAITSDLHLRSRQDHPERFEALENIFSQVNTLGIRTLVIAGDLFDAQFNNYAEFEAICRQPENRDIAVLIIPGNHDPNLSPAGFSAANIRVYSQVTSLTPRPDLPTMLMVPYLPNRSMGEAIAEFTGPLAPDRWILFGHGDWMGNAKSPNLYEGGSYMPLTQRDLDTCKPRRVFLGHIHAAYDNGHVCYAGSPCGMDNTETGRRRFLVYDLHANTLESLPVDTRYLFYNRTFTIFPLDNEQAAVRSLLQDWIASWGLTSAEKEKARLRVRLNGYAFDKNSISQVVRETLAGYTLEKEPDLDGVAITTDNRRGQILNQVKASLASLDWPLEADEPDRDQILLAAVKLVYGR
jgi:exonuclease SbcD